MLLVLLNLFNFVLDDSKKFRDHFLGFKNLSARKKYFRHFRLQLHKTSTANPRSESIVYRFPQNRTVKRIQMPQCATSVTLNNTLLQDLYSFTLEIQFSGFGVNITVLLSWNKREQVAKISEIPFFCDCIARKIDYRS